MRPKLLPIYKVILNSQIFDASKTFDAIVHKMCWCILIVGIKWHIDRRPRNLRSSPPELNLTLRIAAGRYKIAGACNRMIPSDNNYINKNGRYKVQAIGHFLWWVRIGEGLGGIRTGPWNSILHGSAWVRQLFLLLVSGLNLRRKVQRPCVALILTGRDDSIGILR